MRRMFTLLLLLLVTSGCAPEVGDPCGSSLECGAEMICDLSLPEGYCTAGNCEFLGCPEAGICITFPNTEEWCMTACSSNDDCRDGYDCIDEATFLLQSEQYTDSTENIPELPGSYCGLLH